MNLKTLLPVAENNRPLLNEPRDLIRTRHLKEKKMKLNGGPPNGTSEHGARGLYLTPRKRITLGTQPFLLELAPVVQTVDNAIHRINHYPLDIAIGFAITYPVDSDLSGG